MKAIISSGALIELTGSQRDRRTKKQSPVK
jgi:hypothetical protein